MKKPFLLSLSIILATFAIPYLVMAQGGTVVRFLRDLLDVDRTSTTAPLHGDILIFNTNFTPSGKWQATNGNAVISGNTNALTNAAAPYLAVVNQTVVFTNANGSNVLNMNTNSYVQQNGNASNLTMQGFVRYAIYTNVFDTTNVTLNFSNGVKQHLLLTNNALLAASGNIHGTSGDIALEVTASGGTFSVYFPLRASGWFDYGTNTASVPIALTNGQSMIIAVENRNTNINYAAVPVNN